MATIIISRNSYIILSSSCKLVEGKFRAVLIDYLRRELYYLDKEYSSFLKFLNRKQVCEVENILDDGTSIENFYSFLNFLLSKELAFLTDNPSLFPAVSDELRESPNTINNSIITINTHTFSKDLFLHICKELKSTLCFEYQVRMYGADWIKLIKPICNYLATYGARYIEITGVHPKEDITLLEDLIATIPLLSRVYVFGASDNTIQIVSNNKNSEEYISYGEIYFSKSDYNPIRSCGLISKHSLDFSSFHAYNKYKVVNGCLYKKVSIDEFGEVRNCPSQSISFGNIQEKSLLEIVSTEKFRKLWYLTKDNIENCKDCELRYCCTDCRFILENPSNSLSKPLNCKYDIKSGCWS